MSRKQFYVTMIIASLIGVLFYSGGVFEVNIWIRIGIGFIFVMGIVYSYLLRRQEKR